MGPFSLPSASEMFFLQHGFSAESANSVDSGYKVKNQKKTQKTQQARLSHPSPLRETSNSLHQTVARMDRSCGQLIKLTRVAKVLYRTGSQGQCEHLCLEFMDGISRYVFCNSKGSVWQERVRCSVYWGWKAVSRCRKLACRVLDIHHLVRGIIFSEV